MPATALPARRVSLLSWLLLVLGTCGFAAIWVMLGMGSHRLHSWMALLGALDVAWLLRLGGWRPGPWRIALGVTGTAAIVVIANWGIIAAHLGAMLGRAPWDSALRLGWHHAWTLAQVANGPGDLAWIAAALVLAVLATR
jgi:hypothetical protein